MSDRRIPVRRQAVPGRDSRALSRRSRWRPDVTATIIGMGVLVILVGTPLLVIAALTPSNPSPSPGSSDRAVIDVSPSTGGAAASGPAGSSPTRRPSPTPAPPVKVAIVPVVGFWSTERSISERELKRFLEERGELGRRVVVSAADRDAIGEALDVDLSPRVKSASVAEVRAAAGKGSLGLVRATDVTPRVRALAIGGANLFGVRRVDSLADWPLTIEVPADEAKPAFDPARTWTLAAAGDILLDRGVARQVTVLEKGVDFPFDGGNAEITGYTCCSGFGHRVPTYQRTGNDGGMRRLLRGADLAFANLESPVDDEFVYHTEGVVFTADPRLLRGVDRAGFDYLSMGNNHIRDAGADGIEETRKALDRLGIKHGGAGQNLAQARRTAIVQTHGLQIAVISCDGFDPASHATAERSGAAPCETKVITDQVRKAHDDADMVIVWPSWGNEYQATPSDLQREQADAWLGAGADIVIGNGAHWAAGMEEIDGKLAFYALGNFVFDQMWSEPTMEGMVLELTFDGRRLRQAWLHPTIVIDQAQPNFLDPAGDGQNVLTQVQEGSEGLLPY
ncbi:MAG: CapA family protein [Chloroflexi bacterium]|nr:CapA family protein [Chloroflexota bacterium]